MHFTNNTMANGEPADNERRAEGLLRQQHAVMGESECEKLSRWNETGKNPGDSKTSRGWQG
jgi:hypothetical protein